MTIRNPFKKDMFRMAFDSCVGNFEAGLFRNEDGSQNRGGSHKVAFWNGYNGYTDHYTAPNTMGWAAYRAGQACRKEYPPELFDGTKDALKKLSVTKTAERR